MSCSWYPVSGGQGEDSSLKLVIKRNKCNNVQRCNIVKTADVNSLCHVWGKFSTWVVSLCRNSLLVFVYSSTWVSCFDSLNFNTGIVFYNAREFTVLILASIWIWWSSVYNMYDSMRNDVLRKYHHCLQYIQWVPKMSLLHFYRSCILCFSNVSVCPFVSCFPPGSLILVLPAVTWRHV